MKSVLSCVAWIVFFGSAVFAQGQGTVLAPPEKGVDVVEEIVCRRSESRTTSSISTSPKALRVLPSSSSSMLEVSTRSDGDNNTCFGFTSSIDGSSARNQRPDPAFTATTRPAAATEPP